MERAESAAKAQAKEGAALRDLASAAEVWLHAREAVSRSRHELRHRVTDPDEIDLQLAHAAAVVRDLAETETARRQGLPRFEALESAALVPARGPAPELQWFVMHAMGELAMNAHEMMLVEALAAPCGTRVRPGLTWWEDPDAALNAWKKAVDSLLPR
jgi:hypothetical protein